MAGQGPKRTNVVLLLAIVAILRCCSVGATFSFGTWSMTGQASTSSSSSTGVNVLNDPPI